MQNRTYDIILTGTAGGIGLPAARRNLAALFGMSEEQACSVFERAPLVVKKNIDAATAKRFKRAFAQANIEVRFKVSREPVSAQPTPAPADLKTDAPRSIAKEAVVEPSAASTRGRVETLAFKTEGSKAFGFLSVTLPEGQRLWVDSTSVVSSDPHIGLYTHDTSIRKFSGTEGIYISEYTSVGAEGEIGLSPSLPGEIVHMLLYRQSVRIKSSAFLASAAGVKLDEIPSEAPKTSVAQVLRCHGDGDLWLQVCGSVLELDVDGCYSVKSCHLVAWTEGLRLEPIESPLGSHFINAIGHGKIWLQSQTDESLVSWAAQFRPSAEP